MLSTAPDSLLAQRAGEGDTGAFGILVRRHEPLIRVYVTRILRSDADVDDVAQETFLTAWRRLPDLGNTERVRGWLLTIASHKAIDHVRARKNHEDIDGWNTAARTNFSPEHLAESSALATAANEALLTLPLEQARCWVLKEVGAYSYDDIATELRVPVSTVRGLLARARRHMIAEMEAWR